jgi:hypothetical protein
MISMMHLPTFARPRCGTYALLIMLHMVLLEWALILFNWQALLVLVLLVCTVVVDAVVKVAL